jgi:hypothetical protein
LIGIANITTRHDALPENREVILAERAPARELEHGPRRGQTWRRRGGHESRVSFDLDFAYFLIGGSMKIARSIER